MSEIVTWLTENIYVQVTAGIALVGTIAAFLGNLDKIAGWLVDKREKRKKRQEAKKIAKEMPLKTYELVKQMQIDYANIAGTVKNQGERITEITRTVKELKAQNQEQYVAIANVNKAVSAVDTDTGNILCSQLTREHDYYMDKGFCPSADKARISAVYESYKARDRNHLAERFMDDVLSLPEKKRA